jgi:hypothetical protein
MTTVVTTMVQGGPSHETMTDVPIKADKTENKTLGKEVTTIPCHGK